MEARETLTLITINEDGEATSSRDVLAAVGSVTRSEFYFAARADLHPSLTALVHSFEYKGEALARLRGKQYTILRTYDRERAGLHLTELVLEERASDWG